MFNFLFDYRKRFRLNSKEEKVYEHQLTKALVDAEQMATGVRSPLKVTAVA